MLLNSYIENYNGVTYFMGLRSDFTRIARDYYRTFDPKAGLAIKPFLKENYTYAEPYCGRGDLINQLEGVCVYASDIEPDLENKVNDLTFHEKPYRMVTDSDIEGADYIISNPPWSRDILHDSIEYFSKMKPTWFLFDANWMFTKQSKPYLDKYCVKIVTIGRMKWMEGTSMSGKDDCCWYLFDINKKEGTAIDFYGRQ